MEYFLGEYIEDSVQHEVLDTATNKAEYCQYRAAIIRNNCLTKFRGWDKGQIGEKSREKVLDSIINEKIFFQQRWDIMIPMIPCYMLISVASSNL